MLERGLGLSQGLAPSFWWLPLPKASLKLRGGKRRGTRRLGHRPCSAKVCRTAAMDLVRTDRSLAPIARLLSSPGDLRFRVSLSRSKWRAPCPVAARHVEAGDRHRACQSSREDANPHFPRGGLRWICHCASEAATPASGLLGCERYGPQCGGWVAEWLVCG